MAVLTLSLPILIGKPEGQVRLFKHYLFLCLQIQSIYLWQQEAYLRDVWGNMYQIELNEDRTGLILDLEDKVADED